MHCTHFLFINLGFTLPAATMFLCIWSSSISVSFYIIKFWSFQSYLEIKRIIFLGKHTFHISCPKGWAVSHFLADVSMKVSKYLNGVQFWNLPACCTNVQIKVTDTERFGNFGFCKINKDGVSKRERKNLL